MESRRRNHYDVSNKVCIADPDAVRQEVERLIAAHHPRVDRAVLATAFHDFTRLHAGTLPGYAAADTNYHDAQHSLDCTLAAARMIEGHERTATGNEALGARRAVLGVLIALFHDAGYVRRRGDAAANGAAYTLTHVQRSAEFLGVMLPKLGYADEAELAGEIVHFTGFERALDAIDVQDERDRQLGFMIASADLLAQTADRCYLEKCRDFLFPEFEAAGLAGASVPGGQTPLYRDRHDLLNSTPEFNARIWADRLDGYFGGIHRHLSQHFSGTASGRNPYVDCIHDNLRRIGRSIDRGHFRDLTRHPRAIGAACMRSRLDSARQLAA